MQRDTTPCAGWLAIALLVFPSLTPADEAGSRSLVRQLLEQAWDTTDEAKSKATERISQLHRLGDSVEAAYAEALVCMLQRRFEESQSALDRLLKLEPGHLAAHRAKVWTSLLTKNYGAALVGMERLAEAAAKSTEDEATRDDANESARFLGSVYGFVDGPLEKTAAVASRKSTEKSILAALNDQQRMLFTEARHEVMEKFTGLTSDREDSREQAVADAEAEKQKVLADVDIRRKEIAKQAEELEERRDKVQAELNEELQEVARLDRPLASQLTRMQADAAAVQANLSGLALDIDRLEAELAREKDPVLRDRIRRDIDRVSALARRYDGELAAVSRLIAGVQSQRAEVAARGLRAQQRFGSQLQSVNRQLAGFQAEERKLAGAEKKAKKPSTGVTGKVTALGITATALKTYEPFPLEQERQRLLDALK